MNNAEIQNHDNNTTQITQQIDRSKTKHDQKCRSRLRKRSLLFLTEILIFHEIYALFLHSTKMHVTINRLDVMRLKSDEDSEIKLNNMILNSKIVPVFEVSFSARINE